MAVAIHSSLDFFDMSEFIRCKSKKIHPKGNDVIFSIGAIELVNPRVMSADEFLDHIPYLIEME